MGYPSETVGTTGGMDDYRCSCLEARCVEKDGKAVAFLRREKNESSKCFIQ